MKTKLIWYLFKFSEEPHTRWINEKDANMYPSIMNEYLCQKNFNQSLNFQPHDCRVVKDKNSLNKKKTRGLLIMMFSCGICINLEEMIRSESLTQIANLLKSTTELIEKQIIYVIYDNACHLAKFMKNRQVDYPEFKETINLIDRFHLKNHKENCSVNYNCKNHLIMNGINTEVCEQTNPLLNRLKYMSKHMNACLYNFFYLTYFDQNNEFKFTTNNYFINLTKKYEKRRIKEIIN